MTDNEIIKAFRCCYLNEYDCEECPCFKDGHCTDYGDVVTILQQVLDLINRLQAENNKLKYQVNRLKEYDERRDIALHSRLIVEVRTEAIKEFWGKLKNHSRKMQSSDFSGEFWDRAVLVKDGDNLEKYMVGETK